MHETAQEAIDETEMILNIYADFCEKQLAMPVVRGKKTDSENSPVLRLPTPSKQ